MSLNQKMRVWHRYLGFYLAGVMAVYAISGSVLIFRKTDAFKQLEVTTKQLEPNLSAQDVEAVLKLKKFVVLEETDTAISFEGGAYNKQTGRVEQEKKVYPFVLDKLVTLHKATTNSPVYWLNIMFGASLLFFVLSSFWMFLPHTDIFRKGVYFSLAGLVMTIIILFL